MVLLIPDWISVRVYSSNIEKRVYIANELFHSEIMLESFAADLYEFILSGNDYSRTENEIQSFASKNEILDEVFSFIQNLIELGFLAYKTDYDGKIQLLFDKNKNELECDTSFSNDMYSWIKMNGYMPKLFLELTHMCNLKCVHCFNRNNTEINKVTFEEIKPIIDDAYDLGVFHITISGGECTTNKDFLKIVKYIRQKKIQLEIYTNGQNLYDNEDLFNEIVSLYLYKVSLSLYSMDENIHDLITGVEGSQQKTVSIIKKLIDNNINVTIKHFVTSINADSYKDVDNFAKSVGAFTEYDSKLVEIPNKNSNGIRIKEQQLENLCVFLNKKFELNSPNLASQTQNLEGSICGAGTSGLVINPDMNIFACVVLDNIILGNAKYISIKDLWLDKNSDSPLNKLRNMKLKDIKNCHNKEYCKYCVYCPGIAIKKGVFYGKYDQFCEEAKLRMKVLEQKE